MKEINDPITPQVGEIWEQNGDKCCIVRTSQDEAPCTGLSRVWINGGSFYKVYKGDNMAHGVDGWRRVFPEVAHE